jgi:D-alanyl-D-alanine carboxypeptidase-like protein
MYNQIVNDPVKSFDESTLKKFPATFESLEQQGILTPTVALDRLKAGLSAFKNVDGSPSSDNPEDFKDTVEYAWLRQHGGEYSFYESWPEGNEFGMRAEPWHWQYRSS